MTVTTEPCVTEAQAAWVAERLRDEDWFEVVVATWEDPVASVRAAFRMSYECHLLKLNDTPVAIFGVAPAENEDEPGVAWMLCTDGVHKAPRTVLKAMRPWARYFAARYGGIQALAWSRNYLHVRWCKHLGFKEVGRCDINGFDFVHLFRDIGE